LWAKEEAPPLIAEEKAESMVAGKVQFSQFIILSPESDVFPIEPTPKNPCWVVRSIVDGNLVVTIIDAVTGESLGYGVPPPQIASFSLSGPKYENPCSWTWTSWYLNASNWFEQMGYSTEVIEWPTESEIISHIESTETAVFYEVAHGSSHSFSGGCPDGNWFELTTSDEVRSWIFDYTKMPLTFLGGCEGMCTTGPGTFSYEFRKGSSADTATVGYCGMAASYCAVCWISSIRWQNTFLGFISDGYTVEEAFEEAMVAYPMCYRSEGSCMRFAGDADLTLVPVVGRVPSIEVPVDIKPGNCPNRLDITKKGVLTTVILGTEHFDVYEIDIASIGLDGVKPIRSGYKDVAASFDPFDGEPCECEESDADGLDDLTLRFRTQDIVAAMGGVEDGEEVVLTLTGNMMNGTRIEGADCVVIITKRPKRH
jgi:hypothetical protein